MIMTKANDIQISAILMLFVAVLLIAAPLDALARTPISVTAPRVTRISSKVTLPPPTSSSLPPETAVVAESNSGSNTAATEIPDNTENSAQAPGGDITVNDADTHNNNGGASSGNGGNGGNSSPGGVVQSGSTTSNVSVINSANKTVVIIRITRLLGSQ